MSAGKKHFCQAYIGIGSNLDSPEAQVGQAIVELRQMSDCCLTAVSSLYRSAPMGRTDQGDFINAVAAIMTCLGPRQMLASLRTIEDRHGRDRTVERWGPRTLDLDLLIFDELKIVSSDLIVPHPRIAERNFVLLPLCELAPRLMIPGLGEVTTLARDVAQSGIRIEKIGPSTF